MCMRQLEHDSISSEVSFREIKLSVMRLIQMNSIKPEMTFLHHGERTLFNEIYEGPAKPTLRFRDFLLDLDDKVYRLKIKLDKFITQNSSIFQLLKRPIMGNFGVDNCFTCCNVVKLSLTVGQIIQQPALVRIGSNSSANSNSTITATSKQKPRHTLKTHRYEFAAGSLLTAPENAENVTEKYCKKTEVVPSYFRGQLSRMGKPYESESSMGSGTPSPFAYVKFTADGKESTFLYLPPESQFNTYSEFDDENIRETDHFLYYELHDCISMVDDNSETDGNLVEVVYS
ncbi:unnamed protein product [Ambrosiozyma monospora]|uniref:Unnamed protein product n=1 Tax=Ambrosiozyma monospora TaxID=43982 RepID=A0ACB5TAQ6_AMBMO|nr:unnamed protein product [Ambrosiozyma monospora]